MTHTGFPRQRVESASARQAEVTDSAELLAAAEAYRNWADGKLTNPDTVGLRHNPEGDVVSVSSGMDSVTINPGYHTVVTRHIDEGSAAFQNYSVGEDGFLTRTTHILGHRTAPGAANGMFISGGEPVPEHLGLEGFSELGSFFDSVAAAQLASSGSARV